jgi:hypothetical protein
MKKLVIGDSHTSKLSYNLPDMHIKNNQMHDHILSKTFLVQYLTNEEGGQQKIHDELTYYIENDIDITFSSHPGRSAYNFNYERHKYLKDFNNPESLVMPWLGYIDVKNYLPQSDKYKGADEVAEHYINSTMKKFDKANIVFIEPIPQFITIVTANWGNFADDPAIEFEERPEQHLLFVEALKKYSRKNNLPDPINIREVLGCDMIDSTMQYKKPLKLLLNDHLVVDKYRPILNFILDYKV